MWASLIRTSVSWISTVIPLILDRGRHIRWPLVFVSGDSSGENQKQHQLMTGLLPVAPILGPTLGGFRTDDYSWRWVFYINLPVGILAVIMILTFLEDPPICNAHTLGQSIMLAFLR
jgi:MFS family permease